MQTLEEVPNMSEASESSHQSSHQNDEACVPDWVATVPDRAWLKEYFADLHPRYAQVRCNSIAVHSKSVGNSDVTDSAGNVLWMMRPNK